MVHILIIAYKVIQIIQYVNDTVAFIPIHTHLQPEQLELALELDAMARLSSAWHLAVAVALKVNPETRALSTPSPHLASHVQDIKKCLK